MPARPNTPCRHYGCKALVSPPGYCKDHKSDRSGWGKTSVETAHQRGYGWAWVKLRKQILLRDHGLCQVCLEKNKVSVATEVDHITPKSLGGSDSENNLQSICTSCHKLKTHRESRSSRS